MRLSRPRSINMSIKVGRFFENAVVLSGLIALPLTAADMSGRWKISGDVAGNPIQADCQFTQAGSKFAGPCKAASATAEWKVEGLVNDGKVIFHYDVDYQGSTYTLNYSGRFESDTTIKGDIDVGGAGGEFTATKDVPSSAAKNPLSADPQIAAKVNDLLAKMTVDEKIGQLTQIGGIPLIPDKFKPEERVQRGEAGSILWLADPASINRLQRISVEQTRLHIPLLFGLDVIHGFKTTFPIPLAMAASWDPAMVEQAQTVAAREARAAGIQWTFAPMLDIARDARWGRMIEGAGEDPYLGSAIAEAQVKGFQGTDVSAADRVLACAKHFAGYGAADGGRDYEAAYIPDNLLWDIYFPPFRAAVKAGVATFMSAYMDLNDVPATANRYLLRDVLRQDWGFNGFVVSDANAVKDLVTHGYARDPRDAAFSAFTAGVNMDMASRTYLDHLGDLVKDGKISGDALDDMVRPILAAKFRLGLFEHPYVDETRLASVLYTKENRALARTAASESAVLLRNEGQLLPLSKTGYKAIAVIGPLAESPADLLGSWTTFGMPPEAVTLVQGLRSKLPGTKVEYAQGVEFRKTYPSMFDGFMGPKPTEPWTAERSKAEFEKAVALAKHSDLVILTTGELALMSGELASQASLNLPGNQQQLMEAMAGTGKPVVLVLINGRPLNISWAAAHVPAIIEAWHPGTEAGNAIADLLFGDATPGGKLPITWPRSVGQLPAYYAHNLSHDPANQSRRFWDEESTPLFPFGFGLSYTTFSFANLRVSQSEIKTGQNVDVAVDVENTGGRPGVDVVQLYIHQQSGSASRPVRQLKGFKRIALSPHEKQTIHFSLGVEELSYWNSAVRKPVQDASQFDIWAGDDSNAQLHGSFAVTP
jgi:beta-glucosidase